MIAIILFSSLQQHDRHTFAFPICHYENMESLFDVVEFVHFTIREALIELRFPLQQFFYRPDWRQSVSMVFDTNLF